MDFGLRERRHDILAHCLDVDPRTDVREAGPFAGCIDRADADHTRFGRRVERVAPAVVACTGDHAPGLGKDRLQRLEVMDGQRADGAGEGVVAAGQSFSL